MKEGEKPGKFLLPHGIILLEFGPYRIFMEGNPEGIQNQRPLGIMELSGYVYLERWVCLIKETVLSDLLTCGDAVVRPLRGECEAHDPRALSHQSMGKV